MNVHLRSRPAVRQRLCALALGACLLAISDAALALMSCTVSTTTLDFGAYQALTSANLDTVATIQVRCVGLLNLSGYTLSLGQGTNGPGDRISTRYLNNITRGGPYLSYNVYLNNARTTIFGNGTVGSLLDEPIPCILPCFRSYTVYGRIPSGQNTVRPGSFQDTSTLTLTYDPLL
jgi:spore coat protein U-like protein